MRTTNKTSLWFLALFASFLLLALGSSAQLFGESHTKVELLLDHSQIQKGQTLKGAFHLKMEEPWHTYWKNPGGVGLPTEAVWTLPEGWEASPLYWPAPHYLESSGLVSYAYENEVYLPFEISVPPDASAGEVNIGVKLSWLECAEACVPGESDLSGAVTVGETASPSPQSAPIEEAFSKLPKVQEVQVFKEGNDLKIAVPSDFSTEKLHFFPARAEQILDEAPQVIEEKDGSRYLRVQGAPQFEGKVQGVLSDGQNSIEFSSLPGQQPVVAETASLATIALTCASAFLGGLVLNLMPCVFPVLSLKVIGIVEQSNSEGRPAWHHGAIFTFGVLVSFWVMSGLLLLVRAAGQGVGWGYHLQNPFMIAGLGALFLLIALNLFGLFEVGENLSHLSGVAEKKEGLSQSFWSGVLTTLAATPCTAPFMGGAVGFALAQPAWVALIIFSTLALGVAAPYMALTLFPGLLKWLPKPGAWMVTFKQLLAFPMLVAVVWLAWVFGSQMGNEKMAMLLLAFVGLSFAAWIYGRWGSSFDSGVKMRGLLGSTLAALAACYLAYVAATPTLGEDLWQDFSPELVAQLKADGKPFFLDFTADWCTSCKANELVALSRSEVLDKFQELGVTLVKADWTKKDPKITAALAEYKRAGVPLYVLYPGNQKEAIVLPEVILPSTVLDALKAIEN